MTMWRRQNGSSLRVRGAVGNPCVCGEQRGLVLFMGSKNGSSLRVRGAGFVTLLVAGGLRVIPACAGSGTSLGSVP